MPAKTVTINNNSLSVFTVTDFIFSTPLGIQHSADFTNFLGTNTFTGTTFTTSTTMTSGTSKTFTVDYNYVSTSTGIYTASVQINCTEGLSKKVNVTINVASSSTSPIVADTKYIHSILPYGTIMPWSGTIATIPTGWQLCDGTNSTPNLVNQFIIGADVDVSSQSQTLITGEFSPTKIGGSKDAVLIDHNHTVTDPGHAHTFQTSAIADTGGGAGSPDVPTLSGYTEYAVTGITLNNAGESEINKNLPPYYALAYIMKMTNGSSTYIS